MAAHGCMREAAEAIKKITNQSNWYFRRLKAVTHNGVFLLSTPTDVPEMFLGRSRQLSPPFDNINILHNRFVRELQTAELKEAVTVSLEPCSIRIAVKLESDGYSDFELSIGNIVKDFHDPASPLYVSKGTYGSQNC